MSNECHRLRMLLEQWLVCCCLAGARTSSPLLLISFSCARWCAMLDGDPTTPTPPPPQTSIALDALQQQQQQQRSYLHYVAHLPSVKATAVSQREQSLLSLVVVENEELARVNDQERVSFDTLSLLALRSAFVLPSGPLERRKRRKDKKRSSSKKHRSKKVRNYVC